MKRLLVTGINAGGGREVRIVGGSGATFTLDDGRAVVDGSNTGCPLGHGHPAMVEAVRRAATLPVVSEGWLWVEREQAAQDLVETAFAGEDWVGAVRLCLSGSEANDIALSLAQALTGRAPVATRERAYHGLTGLARDVTVQPHWHGGISSPDADVRPVPRGTTVHVLPAPRGARAGAPEADPATLLADVDAVAGCLRESAAVVVDYSQGGIYHDPAYQDAVAAHARAAGALWIADEVVTGFRRTGRFFGFQGGTARPDMVVLGKPLAGGAAAAGAVVVSREIAAQLEGRSWQTYSTFRGHPLTVAAIRAHLSVQASDPQVARAGQLDALMEQSLLELAARHPSVRRVDGRGLHWTVELHDDRWRSWTGGAGSAPLASRVSARALEVGAAIGTSGERGSLFIAPPLVVSEAELSQLFDALDAGLLLADEALELALL